MGSSKLLIAFTLVVVMAISYDLFDGIGINARTVPPTCYESCNATFHSPECNKMCVGLAYKDGSCMYPPPALDGPPQKRPYFPRCCCNPIILPPPSL
ncbi:PREDICTED: defensin-like protein 69 [Camelina sativa]|uniref:Defensin-like protein 69 n=1 Tax=Camelina sativa TaxID=90675 RepID=A0ABM0XFA9_CAMSA|nr:PREDICTED: defensin-like protein 69 [Camelina sativa]